MVHRPTSFPRSRTVIAATAWLIIGWSAMISNVFAQGTGGATAARGGGVPTSGTAIPPGLEGAPAVEKQFQRVVVPGDTVQLIVDEQPSLDKTYGVSGDGTIHLGDFGRVYIAEKPIPVAQATVRAYLEDRFFRRATVTLTLSDTIEGSVYIIGARNNSMELNFKSDELLSLFEAITKAGGLGPRSNGREVKILRWRPGQGLKRDIITVDVQRMYDTLDFTTDEYLRPRDIVFIPKTGGGEGGQEVLLLGQVASVGYHPWYEGMNVLRILANTGWLGSSPDPSSARILRINDAGGYEPIPIDLNMIASGQDMSQNLPLLPGDILYVPVAGQATAGQVFFWGQVSRPGPYPLPLRSDLMLSQAILQIGPNPFAKLNAVAVTRRSPDGTRYTIRVNVEEILEKGLFEKDFPLQDGDYINVGEKIIVP